LTEFDINFVIGKDDSCVRMEMQDDTPFFGEALPSEGILVCLS